MSARQPYETEENLANERRLLSLIEVAWQCTGAKLPTNYRLDYALHRHKVAVAFVELKSRTHHYRAFPNYIVSANKVISAVALSAVTGLPVFLIVEWTDAIGYTELLAGMGDKVSIRGREDRGDWQDIEPAIEFNISRFKFLTKEVKA